MYTFTKGREKKRKVTQTFLCEFLIVLLKVFYVKNLVTNFKMSVFSQILSFFSEIDGKNNIFKHICSNTAIMVYFL